MHRYEDMLFFCCQQLKCANVLCMDSFSTTETSASKKSKKTHLQQCPMGTIGELFFSPCSLIAHLSEYVHQADSTGSFSFSAIYHLGDVLFLELNFAPRYSASSEKSTLV